MTILEIEKYTSYKVHVEGGLIYTRYSADNWTLKFWEEEHPVTDWRVQELENSFQNQLRHSGCLDRSD